MGQVLPQSQLVHPVLVYLFLRDSLGIRAHPLHLPVTNATNRSLALANTVLSYLKKFFIFAQFNVQWLPFLLEMTNRKIT